MSASILTVSMFGCLFVGLAFGYPVAFVMGGLGFVFGMIGWGPDCILLFGHRVLDVMNNYVLVAVPLFILMAQFLTQSGVAEGLFSALRYLMGPLRGGLALAVVAVCTVFAACTGIVGASIVTMGLLSLPMLLRHGYDKQMSLGVLCAGGALGIIIAPSIMLVIMGAQAALSVGKLFMAALFPGLLLSALYSCYVLVRCWRDPTLGPPMSAEERRGMPLRETVVKSLLNLVPPALLILAVLGTIFFGIATPTEAAGVGAFVAFLEVLAYRKFTWEGFVTALQETGKITSMALVILLGATCFTAVFLGCGGGDAVAALMLGTGLGRWGIFAIMMLIIFILGMFIDWLPIIMITFPVFLPIADTLGFDKLWFVTIIAVILQAGFLTPPFGMALFYLKGIAPPEITIEDIYRGAIPFVGLILVALVLCVVFPQLALWLPEKMIR